MWSVAVEWRRCSRARAKGPIWTPDFRRIDWVRGDSYVWGHSSAPTSSKVFEEIANMTHRIRRAWTFMLAVAPIGAIALVEAAMRRWV